MPWGLKRYYGTGALHFITCSCYERKPLLNQPHHRDLLLQVIEATRQRYQFAVVGYVIMPEHFHILMSEPQIGDPSTVMQAIKLSYARKVLREQDPNYGRRKPIEPTPETARVPHFSGILREVGPSTQRSKEVPQENHIWQKRFYDFNVWSQRKESEKLHYMHQNPVVRGLVHQPEDWPWSSFHFYASKENGTVRLNDWSAWENKIRVQA
ncbi:MAG TPA: transposase [Candidatus Sulfotelmatobacter sp.]|jgi:putative transposase|nr:transposase [Candidatus Sulfotelmatobacter sp.]